MNLPPPIVHALSSSQEDEEPQRIVGRVRVKICGITCSEDAESAVLAGADALGFNAWQGSKRYLDVSAAGAWLGELPGFVTRVVLCVNHTLEDALRLGALPFIDVAQFHGDESDLYCTQYSADGRPHIRAVRLRSRRRRPWKLPQLGSPQSPAPRHAPWSAPHSSALRPPVVLAVAHVPRRHSERRQVPN